MKKRVFSLILSILVLLSLFAPCAFADSVEDFGQATPDPNCEHDWQECDFSGWEFELKEGLTLSVTVYYCQKCKMYKHVASLFGLKFNYYSPIGLRDASFEFAQFVSYYLAKLVGNVGQFILANSKSDDFNPARDLPGYEDDAGTANVSKEGVLTYVALPRYSTEDPLTKWATTPFQNDYYKDEWHSSNCQSTGKHSSDCFDDDYYFTWSPGGLDAKIVTHLQTAYSVNFYFYWDIYSSSAVPGTYHVAAGQPLFRYRTAVDADETIATTKKVDKVLPLSSPYENYGVTRYLPYIRSCTSYYTTSDKYTQTVHAYLILVTCDPTENTITEKDSVTLGDNTFTGKIYEDTDTKLTYIYPEVPTIGDDGDTVTVVPDSPLIFNPESNTYYIYNKETNNYYYIDYTPQATPTPSPSPSPSPSPAPTETPSPDVTPTPAPTEKPSTPETGDKSEGCDHTGIIAILEEIRDKMVVGFADVITNFTTIITDFNSSVTAGFTSITTNITSIITDFQTAVVQGFADISANFQLAIENLSVNITNIFNKKFEDLPEPSPTPDPSEPTPTPSPDPSEPTPSPGPIVPILPDTQKYIIPTMDANSYTDSHGTWIASGSSFAENRFAYYNAFRPDGFWVNGLGSPSGAHGREMPCWLQIEIPDPENYYVDGYMIKCGPSDNFDVWQILGSNDGETWDTLDSKTDSLADDDEHKYPVTLHKAYKYYRLYIEHFSDYMGVKQFNLLGYDAADVVIPTPSPTPAPDVPDVTPTPAPTDKPDSGDKTNNFWTIIFPNGGDSNDGKKGIFWALVSLILALIAFFTNLAAGVGYLFPFLPDGVVMTINTCLFVVFLFVIIKFIMRSK